MLNYYRSEERFFCAQFFLQRPQMSQYTGHTEHMKTLEFFPSVFTGLSEFSDKKYWSLKGVEHATFFSRDQNVTTAPPRHMSETGSLN